MLETCHVQVVAIPSSWSASFPAQRAVVSKVICCLVCDRWWERKAEVENSPKCIFNLNLYYFAGGPISVKPETMFAEYQFEEDPILAFNFSIPVCWKSSVSIDDLFTELLK